MSENKYQFKGTPGEWHAVEYSGFWEVQDLPYYDEKRLLSYSNDFPGKSVTEEEAEANAYLLAAAPQLLHAAIKTVQSSNPLQLHDNIGLLEQAIHKALNIND